MMAQVDQYLIMSYSTDPQGIYNKMIAAVTYGDTLKRSGFIYSALDCYPGDGVNESYADTPGKQSKSIMLTDIATINGLLASHKSFVNTCIHDWIGWDKLP